MYLWRFAPDAIVTNWNCTKVIFRNGLRRSYLIVRSWNSPCDWLRMSKCYSRNFRAIGYKTGIFRKVYVIVQFCTIGPRVVGNELKHVLKRCDNRKSCRGPAVSLSHATKIVPCKSAPILFIVLPRLTAEIHSFLLLVVSSSCSSPWFVKNPKPLCFPLLLEQPTTTHKTIPPFSHKLFLRYGLFTIEAFARFFHSSLPLY